MFKKLRNDFLIFNMAITSLIIFIAFAIVFFVVFNNMKYENEKKIQSMIENRSLMYETEPPGGQVDINDRLSFGGGETEVPEVTIDSSVNTLNFSVYVDSEGNVIEVNSVYDIPEEAVEEAVQMALSDGKDVGTIKLNGLHWQYAKVNAETKTVTDGQSSVTVSENPQIYFLDVTESYQGMKFLLLTLFVVGGVVLVAIFFVSRMFANRAIEPIVENWERQKQFVADASHELKTPLAIINANYDALMVNEDETIKSQQKWLNHIKIGSDRMAHLVNDMLTLTKMEEGAIQVNKAPFNLSEDVVALVEPMELLIKGKDVELTLFVEPDIVINSDEAKYIQLMTILLDNAVKYVDDGGWIKIKLQKEKKHTVFKISNSGQGIPESDLNNVFDRFYRADKSRAHPNRGHGLGLSIAKSISDLLGGKITAESVEGECTTFSFEL